MTSSECHQQLKSLVNNFELLVSQFKSLLENSCTFEKSSIELDAENDVRNSEDTIIRLPNNLSYVLGLSKECEIDLSLKDKDKLNDEYKRTSKVLNSVIEIVTYRDETETFGVENDEELHTENDKHVFSEIESSGGNSDSHPFIDEEDIKDSINKQEPKIRKSMKRISNSVQKNEVQKKIRPYEPLGYKSGFCIPEDIYNDILNKSTMMRN